MKIKATALPWLLSSLQKARSPPVLNISTCGPHRETGKRSQATAQGLEGLRDAGQLQPLHADLGGTGGGVPSSQGRVVLPSRRNQTRCIQSPRLKVTLKVSLTTSPSPSVGKPAEGNPTFPEAPLGYLPSRGSCQDQLTSVMNIRVVPWFAWSSSWRNLTATLKRGRLCQQFLETMALLTRAWPSGSGLGPGAAGRTGGPLARGRDMRIPGQQSDSLRVSFRAGEQLPAPQLLGIRRMVPVAGAVHQGLQGLHGGAGERPRAARSPPASMLLGPGTPPRLPGGHGLQGTQ